MNPNKQQPITMTPNNPLKYTKQPKPQLTNENFPTILNNPDKVL